MVTGDCDTDYDPGVTGDYHTDYDMDYYDTAMIIFNSIQFNSTLFRHVYRY